MRHIWSLTVLGFGLVAPFAVHAAPERAPDAAQLARPADTPPSRGERDVLPSTITPAAETVAASGPSVLIGAVRVEGAEILPPATYSSVIEPFLGKEAAQSDLQALARAVANAVRERGYVFATAMVPEQSVDAGRITVRVDPGDVVAVRITGSTSMRLQRILNRIVGKAVTRDQLERALLLAGDIPGVEIVSTRYAREAAGPILIVDVREHRAELYAGADTFGARDLGPVRARLRYDFFGLAEEGDMLTTQVVATPLHPDQLVYASVRYAVPVGSSGAEVALSAAVGRAAPKPNPGEQAYVSHTISATLSGSVPLLRRMSASVWANAELTAQRTTATTGGLPSDRDALVTAAASLYATAKTGQGRVSGSIGVVQGLPLGGVTRLGDPRATRADGDAVFTKGYFWADWQQPIGHGFGIRIGANGQIADRPLLSSQEFGLGGPGSVRAYDFYERFGDSGIMGSFELRWRKQAPLRGIDWIQFYGFADTGEVWNLNGGYGDGRLSALGGGLRAAIGSTDLQVEVAAPVETVRAASGDKSPRINVSIGRRFR